VKPGTGAFVVAGGSVIAAISFAAVNHFLIKERMEEATRRAAAAEATLQMSKDRADEEWRELRLRIERADQKISDLQKELHASRSKSAQLLIEKSEAESAAAVARRELEEARSAASAKPAPAAEEAPAPEAAPDAAAETKRTPLLEPKATALGPTAVTDPGQVKKLVDGLNTLLAGAEEPEAWSVTSAEAVDGDRLVRAVVEARARTGGLSRSFRAEEVRFTLVPSSRSLEVRFREGAVTYPGERTISFPGGRYAAVLAVDPTAFRNAAHPLVTVPSK
jgi:hypothetical protein